MIREIKINRSCELAVRPRAIENHLATRARELPLVAPVRELKESKAMFGLASVLTLSAVFGCANIAEMGAKEKDRISVVEEKDSGLPDVIEDVVKDTKEEVVPDAPIDVIEDVAKDTKEDVIPDSPIDVIEDVAKDTKEDVIPDVVTPDVIIDVIEDVVTEEGGLQPLVPVLLGKANLVGIDDFTLPPSKANLDGWLILMRNNMKCWKASENIMPSAAADPWTLSPLSPPAGSISTGVEVDSLTNEKSIWLNTMSSNSSLYWSRGAGLNNNLMWCVQGRARIENSTAKGQGSSFNITDGAKNVQIGLLTNLVRDTDNDAIQGAAIDMSAAAHSLMICGTGSDYLALADDAIATRQPIAINGVGNLLLTSSENQVKWGDLSAASGINAFGHYMHFCAINDFTGYVDSGSVDLLFDLGSSVNNLGSGNVKPQIIGTLPTGTNLVISGVRGGNGLPLTGSFAPLGALGEITGVNGRYVEAKVTLTTDVPGGYQSYSPLYKGINFQGLTGSVDN